MLQFLIRSEIKGLKPWLLYAIRAPFVTAASKGVVSFRFAMRRNHTARNAVIFKKKVSGWNGLACGRTTGVLVWIGRHGSAPFKSQTRFQLPDRFGEIELLVTTPLSCPYHLQRSIVNLTG